MWGQPTWVQFFFVYKNEWKVVSINKIVNHGLEIGLQTDLEAQSGSHGCDWRQIREPACDSTASLAGMSPSQTPQQSQTPQEGEDLNLCKKSKKQNKNPYRYLTSFLHRRPSEEDQTGILASADSEGPNYGTLHWPVCPPSHWTQINWPLIKENPKNLSPPCSATMTKVS